jgi:hypothetical protein
MIIAKIICVFFSFPLYPLNLKTAKVFTRGCSFETDIIQLIFVPDSPETHTLLSRPLSGKVAHISEGETCLQLSSAHVFIGILINGK